MARCRRARLKHKKHRTKAKKASEASSTASVNPKTGFLDLPGELRNRIYRMVLVVSYDGNCIEVQKGNFSEPPLLLVCRQIRREALKIYYLENTWLLDCPNWDPTIYKGFFQHITNARGIHPTPTAVKTEWKNSGSHKCKSGLLAFIRLLHEDQNLRPIKYENHHYGAKAAPVGAFGIARRLKDRPWEEVKDVLDIYLHEIAKSTPGRTWE